MISIILNNKEFEHDTYALVKAFYPEEKPIVTSDGFVDLDALKKANKITQEDDIHYYIKVEITEVKCYLCIETKQGILLERSQPMMYQERKERKNEWNRFLYHCLTKVTKRELPWGILTGIRPTKLVLSKLEANEKEEEIRTYMKQEYLCSDEKLTVSFQIAKRELELLTHMDYKNGYSIYIGIPFCPTICNYCSFASYSLEKHENILEEYLLALEKEIIYASTCIPNKQITTIYVGGGTPTSLNEAQLERLLIMIRANFDFSNVFEFTVEAGRPDSITKEKLELLKKYQVDRISINPQTMHQKTLNIIGRKHTTKQIVDCYHMAREVGHNNINMDIILGLSGENPEDVAYTLKEIGSLNPDSLTVHTLAIKRAADLNINREKYKEYQACNVGEMLRLANEFTKEQGYEPYYLYRQKNMADNLENVGYAKIGKEGLYNILIMEEKQTILALGAGGMSKFVFHEENRIERVDNVKSIRDYMERIDEMIERKRTFIQNNMTKL